MQKAPPKHQLSLFALYAFPLCYLSAFLIPLKLSLSYVTIVPLLFLWLLTPLQHLKKELWNIRAIVTPFFFLVLSIFFSSLYGVNPWHSIIHLSSLCFFGLLPFAVMKACEGKEGIQLIFALLLAQSLAAFHTIFDSAFPTLLPRLFLGAVTESGQLALSVVITLGLVVYLKKSSGLFPIKSRFYFPYGLCALNFCLFFATAFSARLQLLNPYRTPFAVTTFLALVFSLYYIMRIKSKNKTSFILPKNYSKLLAIFLIILPLLTSALLANLKRGPWVGVLLGSSLFLANYAKRFVFPLILCAFLVSVSFSPIRTRLMDSGRDFFISGGRSVLWEIGAELFSRYPLGIGLKNGAFLQKFSTEIPPQLTHLHNNFLNILVETGWISLGLYLWWLLSLFKISFSTTNEVNSETRSLVHALGYALLSWQIAGLVEYNFGDSEVLLLVFMVIGVLAHLTFPKNQPISKPLHSLEEPNIALNF